MLEDKAYATSPLGRSLAVLIEKLNDIKHKYPKSKPREQSAEEVTAWKLLDTLEKMTQKAHQHIFPCFNNQERPSFIDWIGIRAKVRDATKLQTEFTEKLTIAHPITFELAELLLSLSENAPLNVREFIPFFHTDSIGLIVQKLTNSKTIRLIDEEILSFKTDEDIYSCQTHYTEFKENYSSLILPKMIAYLTNNPDNSTIQNYLESVNILQQFVVLESQVITNIMASHLLSMKEKEPIEVLSHIIQHNQSLILAHDEHIDQLQNLLHQYLNENVGILLERHPQLTLQAYPQHFNTSTLPQIVVGTDGMIPIKRELQKQVIESISLLEGSKKELQQKIQTQTQQWQQQTIKTYCADIQSKNELIQTYQDALASTISDPDDLAGKDVETIKQMITIQKESLDSLLQININVKTLEKEIREKATLSTELISLDKDHAVQTKQAQESEMILHTISNLIDHIKISSANQKKRIDKLESHLEKMESEAAFLNSIQLANPQKIQEMILSLEAQLSDENQQLLIAEKTEIIILSIKSLYATAIMLDLLPYDASINIEALMANKKLAYEFINDIVESIVKSLEPAPKGAKQKSRFESLCIFKEKIPEIQQELNTNFEVLEKRQALTSSHLDLTASSSFITQMQSFQQKIQDVTDTADGPLDSELVALQKQYKELGSELSSLTENNKVTPSHAEWLSNLRIAAHQRLLTTIKSKIGLKPLHTSIIYQDAELTEIASLIEYAPIQQIKMLVERYTKVTDELSQQHQVLAQLCMNIVTIEDPSIHQEVKALNDLQSSLETRLSDIGNMLAEHLIDIFNELKIEAQVFATNKRQESIEEHNEYVQKLLVVEKSLHDLPTDHELETINLPSLDAIKLLRKEVIQHLKQSTHATTQLLHRIEVRQQVVETLQERLTEHNQLKLVNTLDIYKQCGDSTPVLYYLEQNPVNPTHNIKLYSLSNRITADLMDLDQKIPTNYYQQEIPETSDSENSLTRKAILSRYKEIDPNSNYPEAIESLYALIHKMAKKWQKTTPLTQKLTQIIDFFVLKHPRELPNSQEFNQFAKHFTARLHSQDDLMCKHRSAWKAFLGNFIIGLFTLGIALGVKAVYSSVTEGKPYLFFERTQRERHVSGIVEIVEQVKNNVP